MHDDEIKRLWAEYKEGPDYANVFRWAEEFGIERALSHLFASAIKCATDPKFLQRHDPPEASGQ